jgi:N-acetyl-gamma-glutamyl-phosphate reductase
MEAVPVAVVGASGYTGGELLRLLLSHPHARITGIYARRAAGEALSTVFPQFRGRLDLPIASFEAKSVAAQARVAFSCLPHGESAEVVRALHSQGLTVIDLSADFRLRDPAVYETWYGHRGDPLCQEAVYGLPELFPVPPGARLVAAPGCYPTAALLALAPLVRAGLVERTGIIIDAKSGVSGAGRTPTQATHFPEAHGGIRAYQAAGAHRHIPEIEQGLETSGIVFTPHLLPLSRGLLATCYATPTDPTRSAQAYQDALAHAYTGWPLIAVTATPPDSAHVHGSSRAHVFATLDARAPRIIAMCALDNLGKGAAGQAVQCMNLVFGYAQDAGLGGIGLVA